MFAKLPIVASRIEENVECVSNESAYLFEVRDAVDLARAVNQALKNRNESLIKAERAFMEAHEKFEITRIAEGYEATYDKLLAEVNKKAKSKI